MKRLRLTPEAELDLDDAYSWYRAQAPGLAANFLAVVGTCLGSIRRHPEAYQWSTPQCGEHSFGGFLMPCFTRSELSRSWSMRCSTAREILAPGCADGTDNFAVERTRFARR